MSERTRASEQERAKLFQLITTQLDEDPHSYDSIYAQVIEVRLTYRHLAFIEDMMKAVQSHYCEYEGEEVSITAALEYFHGEASETQRAAEIHRAAEVRQ